MAESVTEQKLKLRREVIKFIYDIRVYQEIMASEGKELNKNKYLEYLTKYNDWIKRIDGFIAGAKEGLVNLSVLSVYSDDLYKELKDYSAGCSEEKQDELSEMINEIEYLILCMPNIATLCTELMRLHQSSYLPVSKEELNSKIEELLSLAPYRSTSSERAYLTERFYHKNWYSKYFYKDEAKEEMQDNFANLIQAMVNGTPITSLLRTYINAGAVLKKEVLLSLITIVAFVPKEKSKKILAFLGKERISFDFSFEEFIESYFESVQNEEDKWVQRNKITDLILSMLLVIDNYENEVLSMVARACVKSNIDELVVMNVAADLLSTFPKGYIYNMFKYKYGYAQSNPEPPQANLARTIPTQTGTE